MERLCVQAALTGHDEACPTHGPVEAQQIEQQLDAGSHGGAEQGEGGEAHPARGPGAGGLADVPPGGLGDQIGEAGQSFLQDHQVVAVGALLRAVDGGGAARPEQRVVHVAGHHDLDPAQRVGQRARVDLREPAQRGPAGREFGAVGIAQTHAERLHHARAAVRTGAAAEAEHDPPGTERDGPGDQLADPVGPGRERGGPAAGQPGEPGGLRQLHHGGVAPDGERGGHRQTGRTGHLGRDAVEAGRQRGSQGALAAVGDGQFAHLGARGRTPDAGGDPGGHLGALQGALELVGGDDHMALVRGGGHGAVLASVRVWRWYCDVRPACARGPGGATPSAAPGPGGCAPSPPFSPSLRLGGTPTVPLPTYGGAPLGGEGARRCVRHDRSAPREGVRITGWIDRRAGG